MSGIEKVRHEGVAWVATVKGVLEPDERSTADWTAEGREWATRAASLSREEIGTPAGAVSEAMPDFAWLADVRHPPDARTPPIH